MKSLRLSTTMAPTFVLILLAVGALVIQMVGNPANAQQRAAGAAKAVTGRMLLDPSDTAILLLDHQSGLFQTVKDISVAELRANTVALAKLASLMKIPVITTASEPNGPNGPLMPEIHQFGTRGLHRRKGGPT
jgi:hypothetical protein